jgi:hypothetical protein
MQKILGERRVTRIANHLILIRFRSIRSKHEVQQKSWPRVYLLLKLSEFDNDAAKVKRITGCVTFSIESILKSKSFVINYFLIRIVIGQILPLKHYY